MFRDTQFLVRVVSSPPSKTDSSRSEYLFKIGFEFYRALESVGGMQPDGIVICFDIFKYGLPHGFTSGTHTVSSRTIKEAKSPLVFEAKSLAAMRQFAVIPQ